MAEFKIVFVDEDPSAHSDLKSELKAAGHEISACRGGFDALDELGSQGADIVIASTSLQDLSGYQLSCLIKSNDRTSRLPIVLIKGTPADQDEFWRIA